MASDFATQAQMEAEAADKIVTANVVKYHDGITKAWVYFTTVTTTAIRASRGVSSLTDVATGETTINFSTAFSSATSYSFVGGPGTSTGAQLTWMAAFSRSGGAIVAPTTTTFRVSTLRQDTGAALDVDYNTDQFWGDY
jgi:hypothetical protein